MESLCCGLQLHHKMRSDYLDMFLAENITNDFNLIYLISQ